MKALFIFVISCFIYTQTHAQNNGDAIVGKWLKLPKKDLVIEVYKSKGKYNGKISWSKSAEKPVGFVIIENLTYNLASNNWEKGKIHDPNASTSYSADVKLAPDGSLVVKGYKGFKFISSSRTFSRVKG